MILAGVSSDVLAVKRWPFSIDSQHTSPASSLTSPSLWTLHFCHRRLLGALKNARLFHNNVFVSVFVCLTPFHSLSGKLLFILQDPKPMCPPLPLSSHSSGHYLILWASITFCPYPCGYMGWVALKNACFCKHTSTFPFLSNYLCVHPFVHASE